MASRGRAHSSSSCGSPSAVVLSGNIATCEYFVLIYILYMCVFQYDKAKNLAAEGLTRPTQRELLTDTEKLVLGFSYFFMSATLCQTTTACNK